MLADLGSATLLRSLPGHRTTIKSNGWHDRGPQKLGRSLALPTYVFVSQNEFNDV
jgi:hypothetical protein